MKSFQPLGIITSVLNMQSDTVGKAEMDGRTAACVVADPPCRES